MCDLSVIELRRLEFIHRLADLGICDSKTMIERMRDDIRRATGLPKKEMKGGDGD